MQFINLQSYNKNNVAKNRPIYIGIHASSAQAGHMWSRVCAAAKMKMLRVAGQGNAVGYGPSNVVCLWDIE